MSKFSNFWKARNPWAGLDGSMKGKVSQIRAKAKKYESAGKSFREYMYLLADDFGTDGFTIQEILLDREGLIKNIVLQEPVENINSHCEYSEEEAEVEGIKVRKAGEGNYGMSFVHDEGDLKDVENWIKDAKARVSDLKREGKNETAQKLEEKIKLNEQHRDKIKRELSSRKKSVGIGEAGPVPESLLARQDLEGEADRTEEETGDGIALNAKKDGKYQPDPVSNEWTANGYRFSYKIHVGYMSSTPKKVEFFVDGKKLFDYTEDNTISAITQDLKDEASGYVQRHGVKKSMDLYKSAESDAQRLMTADDRIWRELKFNSGGDAKNNWGKYKAEVAKVFSGRVKRSVWEILEDNNYHSMIEAIQDLGKLDMGKSSTVDNLALENLKEKAEDADTSEQKGNIASRIKQAQIKRQKATLKERGSEKSFKDFWRDKGGKEKEEESEDSEYTIVRPGGKKPGIADDNDHD